MSRLTLVDTSMWTQAIRRSGDPEIKRRVNDLTASGMAAWCDPVRLELWRGVSSDYDRQTLIAMDQDLTKLDVNGMTWTFACQLASAGRTKGMQFPPPDLLIFSCAKQHDVFLTHRDNHFSELEQLWQLIPDAGDTN